MGWVQVNYPG